MISFAAIVATAGLGYWLVRAVMWRLAHGPAALPRWCWLAVPVALVLAGVAWWLGHPELARAAVAVTAGAPFLLATERTWARLPGVELHVDCWHCELERLTR